MSVNRGGRGWDPRRAQQELYDLAREATRLDGLIQVVQRPNETLEQAIRRTQADMAQARAKTQPQRHPTPADVIDLIEVDGVWMTQEDALVRL